MFARLRKLQFFKAVESCTGGYGRFRCQRVNINTRKKKLQRKRVQPLRNSKVIELSGWAKRKDDTIPDVRQDTELQDVFDRNNNPCFWVVKDHQGSDYLQLSQAVNWRFLNLNAAFRKLGILGKPRLLHIFSQCGPECGGGRAKQKLIG